MIRTSRSATRSGTINHQPLTINSLWLPLALAGMAVLCVSPSFAAEATPPTRSSQVIQAIYDRVLEDLEVRNDRHWHNGEFAAHVRISRLMAELCPTCEDVYTNGAWLMESLERHDEATAFYELGLSRNPKSCDMHYDFAQFLFRHDRASEALPHARESVRLSCTWHSWHLLAHIYEHLGRRDDAIKTWKDAIKRFPDDDVAKRNLERLEAGGTASCKQ